MAQHAFGRPELQLYPAVSELLGQWARAADRVPRWEAVTVDPGRLAHAS